MPDPLDKASPEETARIQEILAALPEDRRSGMAELLSQVLSETAQPETVLIRLARFLDAGMTRTAQLELMAAAPRYLQMFASLVDQSEYLTDLLCRNPEYMSWLWEETDLAHTPTRKEMTSSLLKEVGTFETFEARMGTLRRFKRREFLRIAARDLFAHEPLRTVTEDLSNLADACIETAYWCAKQDLLPRYGTALGAARGPGGEAREADFCVLALGKLGGFELNYSSDIDLMFIYSEEGETSGGTAGRISNSDYFHRLGERIIKALSEDTADGHVFRVDMRLRPYGTAGPLAVSLESAALYYEAVGRAWERQALIKARPAAGDPATGQDFLERVRPLVFPRFFDDETLEDIRRLKQQSESHIEELGRSETEVKRGRGGIRDIELAVQMLQLLNGGRFPDIRVGNTLDAIHALGSRGFLSPFEADTLTRNYIFLRTVEHRLQIKGGLQTHELPTMSQDREEFARRLGYADAESFMADYRDRTESNRKILDRFLAAEGSGVRWVLDVLHPQSGIDVGLRRLAALGFQSPEGARNELVQLYTGPAENPNTLRVRQQFTAVAPRLIETLAACGDPDKVLSRLSRLLANLHAPGTVYDILNLNPRFCEYLIVLADNSSYLTNILMQDPGLFDEFGAPDVLQRPATREELQEELEALARAYDPEAGLYRLHDGQTFRTGLRDLLVHVGVDQVCRELTLLAEICIEAVWARALQRIADRYGAPRRPFAVVGLGKLGGEELGYGSDLDLIFVYDDAETKRRTAETAPEEYFAALASQIITGLNERTRYGVLYDVDARLRPYGKQGSLVIGASRLREYYRTEAHAWERLALVKARTVAGDAEFRRKLEAIIRDVCFRKSLRRADIEDIVDIRKKIGEGASARDLKKHTGGLIEIEFTVRLLQMRHGGDIPELHRTGALDAIQGLSEHGILSAGNASTLADAYRFLRRVENRIRMADGVSGSELPVEAEDRSDLARRMGIAGDLHEQVAVVKRNVNRVYREVLDQIRAACS